jgi:DNA-binding HxlR family transcriptional regulator
MLQTSIGSVWGLELLLLLRQEPMKRWTPEQLVDELRSSQLVIEKSLERLERGGLVDRDDQGAVSFTLASEDLEAVVDEIDQEYRLRPDFVRRLIVAGPDDKLNSFANAFILRKPGS